MRRFVLTLVTATALISGTTSAWADTSVEPGSPVVDQAAVTPGQTEVPAVLAEGDPTVTSSERTEARAALAAIEDTPDPTLALRDLSLKTNGLSRSQRASAYSAFQRPWDDNSNGEAKISTKTATGQPGNILVHYLPSTTHPGDGDATTPAWAQKTADVLGSISAKYIAAGYRKPKADGPVETNPYSQYNGTNVNWGGTSQTDVYLMDLGTSGAYGYCAYDIDDSGRLVFLPRYGDVPAFCVLDNDYVASQYRATYTGEKPEDILKVTAAHEYFHAVQFAYDALEDSWFMEATATWAERQVYPEIPDNRQYLPYSPLRFPTTSIDTWNGNGGFLQYGDWIFFEYLTQRFPTKTGPLPNLVRVMWDYADSTRPTLDQYSIQAVASALSTRKASLTSVFAGFAAANLRPAATYRGGAAYPATSPRAYVYARAKKKKSGSTRIDHLASYTVRLKPKAIKGSKHRATISVDLANRSLGTAAVATVHYKNGTTKVSSFKLNAKGNGSMRVYFSSKRVSSVDLTLVNANRSYRSCSSDRWAYSCGGNPTHDNLLSRWTLRS